MTTSQNRAILNYRQRLTEQGLARFEVLGLDEDRALIRSVAKLLAGKNASAARVRAAIRECIAAEQPGRGGIVRALRSSPLVGAELDLSRAVAGSRKVDL